MSTPHLKPYQFLKQLEQLSFIEKIYLYGSRARGDHRERSDIDLAIVCPQASDNDWLKVLEIIENADTLLEIDCLRYDELKDPVFLKNIDRDKITLYERKPS
ncbi:MAG: nucleotidyltransferase domain-containing protein [Gammaproteobacteria bacterium]|nr:nucleotidyltransferase domain-containing protein [Gammaproteobacteria bacterium]MCH9744071.1 nucleotidyltransferase domain-containing protein [Gammaproteobacteria bacterium]